MAENQSLVVTGGQDLLIPVSQTTDTEMFGGLSGSQMGIPRGKINHDDGVFELPPRDGEEDPEILDVLENLVLIHAQTTRIHWDKTKEEGSGEFICRSSDGKTPDAGGAYPGPCTSCSQGKWGGKEIPEKDRKPKCDETVTCLFQRDDGSLFLLQFFRTGLKPTKDFLFANFVRPRRYFFTRYLTLTLKEETYGKKIYYVPQFSLGDTTPAEIQKEGYGTFQLAKNWIGQNSAGPGESNEASVVVSNQSGDDDGSIVDAEIVEDKKSTKDKPAVAKPTPKTDTVADNDIVAPAVATQLQKDASTAGIKFASVITKANELFGKKNVMKLTNAEMIMLRAALELD